MISCSVGGWTTTVTPELRAFLAELDMFYLGTANAEGQPYIQYRGGQEGFLKVIDEKTLGFADFAGNRQYITLGNRRLPLPQPGAEQVFGVERLVGQQVAGQRRMGPTGDGQVKL